MSAGTEKCPGVSRTHARRAAVVVVRCCLAALCLGMVFVGCSEDLSPRAAVATTGIAVVAESGAVELRSVDGASTIAKSNASDQPVREAFFTDSGVVQLLETGDIRWVGFVSGNGELVPTEQTLWTSDPASQIWQMTTVGDALAFSSSDGQISYSSNPQAGFQALFTDDPALPAIIDLAGVETDRGDLLAIARSNGSVVLVNPNSREPGDAAKHTIIIDGGADAASMVSEIDAQNANLVITFADGSIQTHNVASGLSTPLWPPAGGDDKGVAAVDLGFAAVVQDAASGIHVVRHLDDDSISFDPVVFEDGSELQVDSMVVSHQNARQVIAVLAEGQVVVLTVGASGEPVVIKTIGSAPSVQADYPLAAASIVVG